MSQSCTSSSSVLQQHTVLPLPAALAPQGHTLRLTLCPCTLAQLAQLATAQLAQPVLSGTSG